MDQREMAHTSMYEHYYNLRENPFSGTTDPHGYFVTASTREAMASIIHGVRSRKGFITLVGQPGSGKTTLLRRVAEELASDTQVAMLFNSGVTFDELLEFICIDLGIVLDDSRRLTRLTRLNEYLLGALCAGRNVVVIIDDAQTLDDKTLEELRLLTNLETTKEKVLQVVLSGRPELGDKLNQYNLRQVHQRIGVRARLEPLSAGEVGEYVETRLCAVGAERQDLFIAADLARVWKATGGIPQAINLVCDHALTTAFTGGERPVSTATIKQAISRTCGGPRSRRLRARVDRDFGTRSRMYFAAAVAAACCVPILTTFASETIRERTEYAAPSEIAAARTAAQIPPRFETPAGQLALSVIPTDSDRSHWKPDRVMPTELVMGLPGECGNGLVERGEECDDGNSYDWDRCLTSCVNAACGDGVILNGIEPCDDGNDLNEDSCLTGCMRATCGDGYTWQGVEECDDGNGADSDGCLTSCVVARCGDGFVFEDAESCDDGNTSDLDACLSSCVPASCGDGFVLEGVEECDDGNATDTDGCSSRCRSVAPGYADAPVRSRSLAGTRRSLADGSTGGELDRAPRPILDAPPADVPRVSWADPSAALRDEDEGMPASSLPLIEEAIGDRLAGLENR